MNADHRMISSLKWLYDIKITYVSLYANVHFFNIVNSNQQNETSNLLSQSEFLVFDYVLIALRNDQILLKIDSLLETSQFIF